jgi:hypothetical protein
MPTDGPAADWTVSLDDPQPLPDPRTRRGRLARPGGRGRPARPGPSRTALGVLIGVLAILAALWVRGVTHHPRAPMARPTVLGTHLAVPIALNLPRDAVATSNNSYVGVQFDGQGVVLITVPTQVITAAGVREPLPADPALWLRRHPSVFVTSVRDVPVHGVTAQQVEYQRSAQAAPIGQFSRLSLFCGWNGSDAAASAPGSGSAGCTQITPDARVRATFVPVDGRIVLVEAVWRPVRSTDWMMPNALRRSYAALLSGLKLPPR